MPGCRTPIRSRGKQTFCSGNLFLQPQCPAFSSDAPLRIPLPSPRRRACTGALSFQPLEDYPNHADRITSHSSQADIAARPTRRVLNVRDSLLFRDHLSLYHLEVGLLFPSRWLSHPSSSLIDLKLRPTINTIPSTVYPYLIHISLGLPSHPRLPPPNPASLNQILEFDPTTNL